MPADRACVNTLAQALDLCDGWATGVGVAIDVYHVWWDPDLEAQIARAGAASASWRYHICDWLVPTRDILNDRGMMGDGVIDLPRLRAAVARRPATAAASRWRSSPPHWWSGRATRCCDLHRALSRPSAETSERDADGAAPAALALVGPDIEDVANCVVALLS